MLTIEQQSELDMAIALTGHLSQFSQATISVGLLRALQTDSSKLRAFEGGHAGSWHVEEIGSTVLFSTKKTGD